MNQSTLQMRMNNIREKLREKCDAGLLGTVAARARVAEYELRAWCQDATKTPSAGIVADVGRVLAQDHYPRELSLLEGESRGFDPYNSRAGGI